MQRKNLSDKAAALAICAFMVFGQGQAWAQMEDVSAAPQAAAPAALGGESSQILEPVPAIGSGMSGMAAIGDLAPAAALPALPVSAALAPAASPASMAAQTPAPADAPAAPAKPATGRAILSLPSSRPSPAQKTPGTQKKSYSMSELRAAYHPSSKDGPGTASGAASAAGQRFDGSSGQNRGTLVLPGTPASAKDGEDEDARELSDLRGQIYDHIQALEHAATRSSGGAEQAAIKKQTRVVSDFFEKIETAGMPRDVELTALRELSNYLDLNPRDSEAQKIKTYLSWLTAVPWAKHSEDRYDLAQAKKILDRDHSGLDQVKKRILEFLAVRKRVNSAGGGILLFIGPPGVGKTSIAQAIAESMGRKFVRFSLGGVADETNIRGHNRTYLGSQPGSIMRLMKQAGVNNPVMLLDEIDKMPAESGRGSAQPAFLEVLDPEQNSTFQDHYMEVPYDLSKVLFIVTANDMSEIPAPLRDRMEVIEFSGYTTAAKAGIIKNQVLPQTAKSLGIDPKAIRMSDDAMEYLVESYTAEPGVRDLKRQVGAILRGIIIDEESSGKPIPSEISKEMVRRYLGKERHTRRAANVGNGVGYASGLAVNSMGGSVLGIEVRKTPGKGEFHLRKLMKEYFDDSAHNAYVYIKSEAASLGISPSAFETGDLDIAVSPATPIDGPSAGITMATAMASELTGRAVRPGIAMTGELTIHGAVKAIGGLKDKIMAAYRLGYKTIIFPAENERDLDLLPDDVRANMTLIPVTNVNQVFEQALEPATRPAPPPTPVQREEKRGFWQRIKDILGSLDS
ncbi:MAG: endopeptidase La [Elusimicrobiota bacterium]